MPNNVIVDSQLLLLLVVGLAGERYILRHRRLKAYRPEDYRVLLNLLTAAEKIVVTPNTLTETSNLLGYIGEPDKSFLFQVFRKLIDEAQEFFFESGKVANRSEFPRLGLTDSALLEVLSQSEKTVLLTSDLDLYLAAGEKGYNFHHLRKDL